MAVKLKAGGSSLLAAEAVTMCRRDSNDRAFSFSLNHVSPILVGNEPVVLVPFAAGLHPKLKIRQRQGLRHVKHAHNEALRCYPLDHYDNDKTQINLNEATCA